MLSKERGAVTRRFWEVIGRWLAGWKQEDGIAPGTRLGGNPKDLKYSIGVQRFIDQRTLLKIMAEISGVLSFGKDTKDKGRHLITAPDGTIFEGDLEGFLSLIDCPSSYKELMLKTGTA